MTTIIHAFGFLVTLAFAGDAAPAAIAVGATGSTGASLPIDILNQLPGGQGPWMAVLAVALLGYGLRWLSTGGIDLLVAWEMRRLVALINRPIEDPDVAHFWKAVILEGAVLAERKLPDSGLGPQRKAWLTEMFFRAMPFLRSAANEKVIGDGIDRVVRENDQMLKDLAAKLRAEHDAQPQLPAPEVQPPPAP